MCTFLPGTACSALVGKWRGRGKRPAGGGRQGERPGGGAGKKEAGKQAEPKSKQRRRQAREAGRAREGKASGGAGGENSVSKRKRKMH